MSTPDDLSTEIGHVLNCLTDAERRLCSARIRLRQLASGRPVPPLWPRVPLARLGDALTAISCARRCLNRARPTETESEVEDEEEVQR